MQGSQNMASEISLCPVCQREYDSSFHTPKILFCGHTVCFDCLNKISFSEDRLKCPFCRKLVPRLSEGNSVPTNFIFLSIIELQMQQRKDFCNEHPEYKKDHICLVDRCRICLYCTVYGAHKDHRSLTLKDFSEQAEKKCKELELPAREFENWSQDIDRMFNQEKEALKKHISESFNKILKSMNYRQSEILREIDKYFSKEARKIKTTEYYMKNMQIVNGVKRQLNEIRTSQFDHLQFSVLETIELGLVRRPMELELESLKRRINQFSDPIYNNLSQLAENRQNDLNKLTKDFESTLTSFSLLSAVEGNNNQAMEIQRSQENGPMNVESRGEIMIYINTFDGPLEMKVRLDDDISSIKQRLRLLGDSYQNINLLYDHKILKDSLSVLDYNIQTNIPLIVKSIPRYICV